MILIMKCKCSKSPQVYPFILSWMPSPSCRRVGQKLFCDQIAIESSVLNHSAIFATENMGLHLSPRSLKVKLSGLPV